MRGREFCVENEFDKAKIETSPFLRTTASLWEQPERGEAEEYNRRCRQGKIETDIVELWATHESEF